MTTSKKEQFILYKDIGNLFRKLRNKSILNENVYVDAREKPNKELLLTNKFSDVIIYYRMLKRYSLKDMASKVGISADAYHRYEIDKKRLNNISTIESIVNVLEMEEKYIADYIKFIKNNPVEIIKRYISKHNLSYVEFAKKSNISASTLYGWLEGKTSQIPVSGYEKLKTYIGQDLLIYM